MEKKKRKKEYNTKQNKIPSYLHGTKILIKLDELLLKNLPTHNQNLWGKCSASQIKSHHKRIKSDVAADRVSYNFSNFVI